MIYKRCGDVFLFEKDDKFLEVIKSHLSNGVIKKYPDIFCVEPLPEVISKDDYDYIFIDGKEVPYDQLLSFSKDRLKSVFSENQTKRNSVKIEGFYQRKYCPDEIEKIFIVHGCENIFFGNFLGFELIGLKAN